MTDRDPDPGFSFDATAWTARIVRQWDDDIVPQLVDYIRLPAKSPNFDPQWEKNGHIEAAIRQAERWVKAQDVAGLVLEIVRLPGRTPFLFFEIPAKGAGASARTVALYGHLDKQPEMRRLHRDVRGERQLRPSRLSRGARAAHGRRRARDRARLGRGQLRPAVGDDVAARSRERHPHRECPHRRRALG